MQFLAELWLPILLSSVIAFFASAILWMALPLHKKDFTPPPDENDILASLDKHNFKPGQYYLPWCSGGNMKDPAYLEKMNKGPWAMLVVMGSKPNFGKSLGLWFVNLLIIALLVAYAAAAGLGLGTPHTYLKVFQVVGAIAFVGFGASVMQDSIWKGVPWSLALPKLVDAIVYALLFAGTFAWLWPSPAA